MMPYKHEIGDAVNLAFEITSNNVGVTGQTPVVAVQRISDSQWLNDAKTAWQVGYNDIAMTELDATNLPGVYGTDVTQFGGTEEKWRVFYKNTGTYAGIDVEAHEFVTAVWAETARVLTAGTNIVLAKGTGVTGFNDLSLGAIEATTVLAKEATLTAIKGTTFDTSTDSLEALRNRGDAAWITATGFSTHTAADIWAVATRVLTAGTNIALAKGTGVTGFNDLDTAGVATAIWNAATATYGSAGSYGLLIETNLDATVNSRSTYAGGDTSGVTTLLTRATELRLAELDPANIPTDIANVQAKTGQLAFTVANQVDSNALSGGGLDASRMTYHKHGMGEVITLSFPVINKGVGVTGQTPVAAVRKKSTGEWLNDAKTGWQAGYNDIAMAPIDATNLPGAYTLNITHIDLTSEEYQVYFKNTGTYTGIDFESHIFTGAVYVPPSSSYATGTVRGLLNIAMNKDANNTYVQGTDSLEARADDTRLNNLDAAISSRSTLTAQQVWEYATRTVTSLGTLVADVWGYATRKLTSRNIGVGDDIASEQSLSGISVDLTPVTNAIAALQADLGDPSMDATTIYAKIQALQTVVSAIPVINILSATKGAIQVSYAKSGGTIEIVKGDTISIPYGPLAKDITGRRIYFGVKQLLSDTAYSIAVKEITSSITSFSTFTGTLPLTSAETGLAAGNYYAEIESKAADGLTLPVTEMKFTLRIVDQVIV